MAILTTDILFKLSTTTGTAGNQRTQPNVDLGLGKYISTTVLSATALNNLFSDLTGQNNAASVVDYRCVFVHNSNASIPLVNAVVFIASQVPGGANAAIGVDPTAPSAIGASASQAVSIPNVTTAPAGVTFSAPTSIATGLSLGTIQPGQCVAFWVQRSATNSNALNNDGATFQVTGDTTA